MKGLGCKSEIVVEGKQSSTANFGIIILAMAILFIEVRWILHLDLGLVWLYKYMAAATSPSERRELKFKLLKSAVAK